MVNLHQIFMEKINKRLEFESVSAKFYLKYLWLSNMKFYNFLIETIMEMLRKWWITKDYLQNISIDNTTELLDEIILANYASLPDNYIEDIYTKIGIKWNEMPNDGQKNIKSMLRLNSYLFKTSILKTFFLFFDNIVNLKTAFSPYIIASDKDKLFDYQYQYLKKPAINQLSLTKSTLFIYIDLFLSDIDVEDTKKQIEKIFDFFWDENDLELYTNIDYIKYYLDIFRKHYENYNVNNNKIDKTINDLRKQITNFKIKKERADKAPQKYKITMEEVEQFNKNKKEYLELIIYKKVLSFINQKELDLLFLSIHIDYIDEIFNDLNNLPKIELEQFIKDIGIFWEIFSILRLLFGYPNIDFLVMLTNYLFTITENKYLQDLIKNIDNYFIWNFNKYAFFDTYIIYDIYQNKLQDINKIIQVDKKKEKYWKLFENKVKQITDIFTQINDVNILNKIYNKDKKTNRNIENNFINFRQFILQSWIFSESLQNNMKNYIENIKIKEINKQRRKEKKSELDLRPVHLYYINNEFIENSVVLDNEVEFLKHFFSEIKDKRLMVDMISWYIDKKIDNFLIQQQNEKLLTDKEFILLKDKKRLEILESIINDVNKILTYINKDNISWELEKIKIYKDKIENSNIRNITTEKQQIIETRLTWDIQQVLWIKNSVDKFFGFIVDNIEKISLQDLYLVYLFYWFTKNEPLSVNADENWWNKYLALEYDDVVYFLIDNPSLSIFTDIQIGIETEKLYKGKNHIFLLTNFEFRKKFLNEFVRSYKIPWNVSYYMKELMKYIIMLWPENVTDMEFYWLYSEQTWYCTVHTKAGWKVVEWRLHWWDYSPFLPYSMIEQMLKDVMEMKWVITDEENSDTSVSVWQIDNRTNIWKNSFSIKGTIRRWENPWIDTEYESKAFRLTARKLESREKWFTLYDAYSRDDANVFRELVYKDKGLFIISAPTWQGKTTALNNLADNVLELKIKRENLFAHMFEVNDTIENRNLNLVQVQTSMEKIKFKAEEFLKRSNPEYVIFWEIRNWIFLGTLLSIAKSFSTLTTMHSWDVVSAVSVLKTFWDQAQIWLWEIVEYVKCIVSQRIYTYIPNSYYDKLLLNKAKEDFNKSKKTLEKAVKELHWEYIEYTPEELENKYVMEIRSKLLSIQDEIVNQFALQWDTDEDAKAKWIKIARKFYEFPMLVPQHLTDDMKWRTTSYEYLTNSQIKRLLAWPERIMNFSKVENIDYKFAVEHIYIPKELQMFINMFTMQTPISVLNQMSLETMWLVMLLLENWWFFNQDKIDNMIEDKIEGMNYDDLIKKYKLNPKYLQTNLEDKEIKKEISNKLENLDNNTTKQ